MPLWPAGSLQLRRSKGGDAAQGVGVGRGGSITPRLGGTQVMGMLAVSSWAKDNECFYCITAAWALTATDQRSGRTCSRKRVAIKQQRALQSYRGVPDFSK